MSTALYRYQPKSRRAPFSYPRGKRRLKYFPMHHDMRADHEWLKVHPYCLARVHKVDWGALNLPIPPLFIVAFRVQDPRARDGWRTTWLEIVPEPFNMKSRAPTFLSPHWDEIVARRDLIAENNYVLAVLEGEARKRPEARLVRDMLVVLRVAGLGKASDDFKRIEAG